MCTQVFVNVTGMAPNDSPKLPHKSSVHRQTRGHLKGRLEHDGSDLEADDVSYVSRPNNTYIPNYKAGVRPEKPRNTSTNQAQKKKKKKSKNTPKENANVPSPTTSLESYEEGREKTINFVKNMGFTDQEIHFAIQRLAKQPITTDTLLDEVYKAQDELISLSTIPSSGTTTECSPSSGQTGRGKLQTDGGFVSDTDESDFDDGASRSSEDDHKEIYQRAVEREKMKYRHMIEDLTMMCKVCNCSRATILLLPCGHLVCCDDCLMDVRRCPVNRCDKVVRGTKEVYFS